MGYIPPYAPSVADWMRGVSRDANPLLQAFENRIVDVTDFGAVPNGLDDAGGAISQAIAYLPNGGVIRFPSTASGHTYKISSEIANATAGIRLVGDARNSTQILQYSTHSKIINNSANFFEMSHLRLLYNMTPVSGGTAIYSTGGYGHFHDFTVANAYAAVEMTTGVANKIHDFELQNYESVGLYAHSLNDLYVSRFIINAGNTTRGSLGGIRLQDKAEWVTIADGDVLSGAKSITTDATVNGPGSRPAYSSFRKVGFDSSLGDNPIKNVAELSFDDCWWSCRGGSGAIFTNVDGLKVRGGSAINNGSHGLSFSTGCKNFYVGGGFAPVGNSQNSSGNFDGINIAAGLTDFIVDGILGADSRGFTDVQRYLVRVAAGASDRYVIRNILTGGNAALVSDLGTGTNKDVGAIY